MNEKENSRQTRKEFIMKNSIAVTVTITEQQLDKILDDVDKYICKEWFMGDNHEFEDWAGDVVYDYLLEVIKGLKNTCGIDIQLP